jgi:hypothetical protein
MREPCGMGKDGLGWAWGDEGYGWKEHADTVRLALLAFSPSRMLRLQCGSGQGQTS